MTNQVIGVTIKGIGDFSDVISNVGSVQKALTKLKVPEKLGTNLNKNIDSNSKNENKYMNLGCIEERNRNYETVTYDYNFGSNRKVIDDFINQLKTNN